MPRGEQCCRERAVAAVAAGLRSGDAARGRSASAASARRPGDRGRRGTARRSGVPSSRCSSGAGARTSGTYVASASSSVTSRPSRSDSNQRCSSSWWKISAACSLPTSDGGIGADDRLEDLVEPAHGDDVLRRHASGAGLQLGAEAADVVEQPAGLVLARPQPGQGEQPVLVVAALDDARHEAQAVAVVVGEHLHLGDVEAEVVEPAHALLDPPQLVGARTPRSPSARPTAIGSGPRGRRRSPTGRCRRRGDRRPAGRAARRRRSRRRCRGPSGAGRRVSDG